MKFLIVLLIVIGLFGVSQQDARITKIQQLKQTVWENIDLRKYYYFADWGNSKANFTVFLIEFKMIHYN